MAEWCVSSILCSGPPGSGGPSARCCRSLIMSQGDAVTAVRTLEHTKASVMRNCRSCGIIGHGKHRPDRTMDHAGDALQQYSYNNASR
ncbi:hypothetical protein [Vibrio rhizosphaerae]|nr:hypothetical protein [Vibrio rhizosphaerae]